VSVILTRPDGSSVELSADRVRALDAAALPTLPGAAGLAFDPGSNQLAVWNGDSVQLWDITHPDVPALQATVVPPGGQGSHH
jgi:hypothetical protein